MRVALHIDSATEPEMRAILLAYHQSRESHEPPKLHPDGCIVKVEGPSHYSITTPPMSPFRASEIAFFGCPIPKPEESTA